MKRGTLLGIGLLLLAACNNASEKPKTTTADTSKTLVNEPLPAPGPPAKVAGDFAGELPCTDCKQMGRMVRIADGGCQVLEHHAGAPDKRKLLTTQLATCSQDSGLITVITDDKKKQYYRIIAADSILWLGPNPAKVPAGVKHYLTKKTVKKPI